MHIGQRLLSPGSRQGHSPMHFLFQMLLPVFHRHPDLQGTVIGKSLSSAFNLGRKKLSIFEVADALVSVTHFTKELIYYLL